MHPRGSSRELEYRRRLAVQRCLEGPYSISEVARFFAVNRSSLTRWIAAYRAEGERGLLAHHGAGRPTTLTGTQEKVVLRWMKENPTQFGFSNELWTARGLSQLIHEEFQVSFNPHYLCVWLRERGMTPQKPLRIAREQDPKAVSLWLKKDWPRIKQKAAKMRAYLAMIDESGLMMAPLLRRTWAPRGRRPIFYQQGRIQKVSISGALCLSPQRNRIGFFFGTLINDYFDNYSVARFLEALLRQIRRPLIVVWDSGRIHSGDSIRELQKTFQGRISLERFPSYAPELNPVESVWNWLKYGKLSNYAPKDVWSLDKRVFTELVSINNDQQMLRKLWRLSDLPLPDALIS